jgi:low temperature requirement protein LtrA
VAESSLIAAAPTAAEQEKKTSYLELFFDLVFVFAITQVTALILHDPTWQGFLRGTLVLALVWWAWGGYTWMTNAIEVESFGVQLAFLGAMAASFFMALGVPGAFGDDALWFAVPYLVVRVLQVVVYVWGLRDDPQHQAAIRKLAPWFLVAPALVLAGAFLDDELRATLWTLSLVVDLAGAFTAGSSGFRVSPSHFAERYGLFMIIALGESIVAIGVGAAEVERDVTFAAAVLVAFAGVAALWWSYFDIPALGAERTLRAQPEERRAPYARDVFSILHYPFVLGVILYAVGAEKTLAHPDEPLSAAGRWALGLGVASTLLGMAAARFRAVRAVARERVAGAALAIAAVVLLRDLDAIWLATTVVLVLVATLAVETLRLREFRRELHGER